MLIGAVGARDLKRDVEVAVGCLLYTSPIPGTKRVARLEENAGADAVVLTPDQLARLDQLTPAVGGHHAEAQMGWIDR